MRNGRGLEEALERIEDLTSLGRKIKIAHFRELAGYLEYRNLLLLSEMVCRASLLREETRGSHYRTDYPEEDNVNWLRNIEIRKDVQGMGLGPVPVDMSRVSPE